MSKVTMKEKIVALLSDGVPRTAMEVGDALLKPEDRSYRYSTIQTELGLLVGKGRLTRKSEPRRRTLYTIAPGVDLCGKKNAAFECRRIAGHAGECDLVRIYPAVAS